MLNYQFYSLRVIVYIVGALLVTLAFLIQAWLLSESRGSPDVAAHQSQIRGIIRRIRCVAYFILGLRMWSLLFVDHGFPMGTIEGIIAVSGLAISDTVGGMFRLYESVILRVLPRAKVRSPR